MAAGGGHQAGRALTTGVPVAVAAASAIAAGAATGCNDRHYNHHRRPHHSRHRRRCRHRVRVGRVRRHDNDRRRRAAACERCAGGGGRRGGRVSAVGRVALRSAAAVGRRSLRRRRGTAGVPACVVASTAGAAGAPAASVVATWRQLPSTRCTAGVRPGGGLVPRRGAHEPPLGGAGRLGTAGTGDGDGKSDGRRGSSGGGSAAIYRDCLHRYRRSGGWQGQLG